ncbi:MAG: alpha/beta hydrolase [Paramuribaculum sp.]|nr:alpha/beta hydrolase [Paramuribaculum sp.]
MIIYLKSFLSVLILSTVLLSSCSEKVLTEQVTLNQDSPIGYVRIPSIDNTKAYILLFPGFGESPDDLLASTDLPIELARHGITVFIPVLQDGSMSYGFSKESQETLAEIVDTIRERYDLYNVPYIAGGFSMGGATAVKFAETSTDKPAALFAIDSPLDYKRFLYATKRDIEVYDKDSRDSIYSQLYKAIDKIKDDSPYEIDDRTHSAIKPLVDVPVRVYIEPAEEWWLNNRQTDALGLNIIDATCIINDLRLMGNDNAEIIVTENKGFRRANNQRHPHSWSIVDNKGLIDWLNKCLQQ